MDPNPIDERLRYPHEKTPAARVPPALPDVVTPERVDPSTQGPASEIPESDWEGQEGVGPGPREAVRREERGEPSPEEPPAENVE